MNPTTSGSPAGRVGSIDAYRGLVMFLMMAEVLALSQVAEAYPQSGFWAALAAQQSHVAWVGCSLHDLIQPSFSFLVGVALPFSLANRMARGQGIGKLFAHAVWRSFLLIALGIFLRSMSHRQTYFTFEDTLTQIGLGYPLLFVAGLASRRLQWIALGIILVGYWAAFAAYPLPGPDFDWSRAGVAADWKYHLQGFAAHWNKNANFAWAFDTWFLNLFPREEVFTHNGGGYSTLSFIPTLGTMILGLIAGGWLREECPQSEKLKRLAVAGLAGLGLGWLLNALGVCPVVKRIWTPAWTVFSGGWCFLFLAAFFAMIDVVQMRFWAFPLLVIGMNSITAYCSDALFVGFIRSSLNIHLGRAAFEILGTGCRTLLEGSAILLILWWLLFWMYRRKLFLKI